MKVKYFFQIFLMITLPYNIHAQFTTGADGFFIKEGTPIFIDGLTLNPSADLDITNNTLEISHTAIPSSPQPSVLRVYQWDSPISFVGNIGFYYDASELNGNDATTLKLQYNSQSGNIGFTPIENSIPTTGYVSATLTTPLNMLQLTAFPSGPTMAVSLLSFDAYKKGESLALLEWVTVYESNSSHFVVERSKNAKHFEALGTVKSLAYNGNSTQKLTYNFSDTKPLHGNNFYRLKQYDFNGSFTYSPVRSLWFDAQSNIKVYPNPADAILYIEGLEGTEEIRLYDAIGRLVLSTKSSETTTTIHLERLTPGTYILKIEGEGKNVQHKIVKE